MIPSMLSYEAEDSLHEILYTDLIMQLIPCSGAPSPSGSSHTKNEGILSLSDPLPGANPHSVNLSHGRFSVMCSLSCYTLLTEAIATISSLF